MFGFFRSKRINRYINGAKSYIGDHYKPEPSPIPPNVKYSLPKGEDIRYSLRGAPDPEEDAMYSLRRKMPEQDGEVIDTGSNAKFSTKSRVPSNDLYNASEVTRIMGKSSSCANWEALQKDLDSTINESFVDRLIYYINIKGFRDVTVYKSAQIDKRLFSKMVSDRDYKPSKDTAIALAFGLRLNLDEANDLLSRAGYTFSHSNKRDVVLEYFFRESIYNLIDINDVLFHLNQKVIGRF